MAERKKPMRPISKAEVEDYDRRTRNYYGHQAANLKSLDELKKRGVKDSTPNRPKADYTFDGPAKRIREGTAQRKKDRFIDNVLRSLKGKS